SAGGVTTCGSATAACGSATALNSIASAPHPDPASTPAVFTRRIRRQGGDVAFAPATAEDASAQEAAGGYFSALAPAKYVLLTTFKWGRTPVSSPVRLVVQGDRAYFQTWSRSSAWKRLRHNDWVQVAPCTALGLYRYGPWLDTTARPLAGE